jgi:uncharacterized BrkB/YihY/UPF0761 family membrane protein|tara:strand:+ start:106 stop:360 length:255 start_codon:yes stop_codon:yes gene_type:complete
MATLPVATYEDATAERRAENSVQLWGLLAVLVTTAVFSLFGFGIATMSNALQKRETLAACGAVQFVLGTFVYVGACILIIVVLA